MYPNPTTRESRFLPKAVIFKLILKVAGQEGAIETNLVKFWYNK
jgi:hypothetical protein